MAQEIIVGDIISKKDLERCQENCDIKQKTMAEKLDEVKNDVTDIKISLAGLPEVLMEKFEKKFASKTTEKIVYGIVAIILIAVIGYWVEQTIKPPTQELTSADVQKLIQENNNKYFETIK